MQRCRKYPGKMLRQFLATILNAPGSTRVTNFVARIENEPVGSRSPRSQRANVLGVYTPIRFAACFCESPIAIRELTRRPAQQSSPVEADCSQESGLWLACSCARVLVRPDSQFTMVAVLTPSRSATSRCRSLSTSLRRNRWSANAIQLFRRDVFASAADETAEEPIRRPPLAGRIGT